MLFPSQIQKLTSLLSLMAHLRDLLHYYIVITLLHFRLMLFPSQIQKLTSLLSLMAHLRDLLHYYIVITLLHFRLMLFPSQIQKLTSLLSLMAHLGDLLHYYIVITLHFRLMLFPSQIQKLTSLLSLMAHLRDFMERMIETESKEAISSFDWNAQLRYYFNKDNKSVTVKVKICYIIHEWAPGKTSLMEKLHIFRLMQNFASES